MPDDGGECLGVHPMFQSGGGEGVPEVMETNLFAPGTLQYSLEPLADGSRVQRRILHDRRWKHPAGGHGLTVFVQNLQDRGGKNDCPVGAVGFGL